MGENSRIAWTDNTFSPWWGCHKVSEECAHCYSERDCKRWGFDVFGPESERRIFGDKHWREPFRWARRARKDGKKLRVFCASMGDVFEDHPALPLQRSRLWDTVDATADVLHWLLLTKRPQNIERMLPPEIRDKVWLGTTAGTQRAADTRLDVLLRVPARLHFVSCEPLLEQVDIGKWLVPARGRAALGWLITGGESGPHARPVEDGWLRFLRDQARMAKVPFFLKQRSGLHPDHTPALDGVRWTQIPEAGE